MREQNLIITANVRGLRHHTLADKTRTILHNIAQEEPVVACLLDTHLDVSTEHKVRQFWDGEVRFSHGDDHKDGIAILLKRHSPTQILHTHIGKLVILRTQIQSHDVLICAVYAPAKRPTDRTAFFNYTRSCIEKHRRPSDTLIVLGDFNCVEHPNLDRNPGTWTDPSARSLSQLSATLGLTDVWRLRNPDSREYTFVHSRGFRSRIDRAYVSLDALNAVTSVEHVANPHSDHSMLHVSFDFDKVIIGRGTWILHQSLLEDEGYVKQVRNFWPQWQRRKREFPSILEWWDEGKNQIQNLSKRYSAKKAKGESKVLRSLRKRLQNAINGGKTSLIHLLSRRLSDLQTARAQSHFTLLKERWVEEGEKCTSYFLSQHSTKVAQTTVKSIRTPTGITSNTPEILSEFVAFYQELYTDAPIDPPSCEQILSHLQLRLTEAEKDRCNRPFTLAHLFTSLKTAENGKSPGSDGLPAEFYKKFWDILGQDLFDVFEASYGNILPESQRMAIIRCIPKKGDIADVRNWRPISLLNADYKIISKCIADRISEFLNSVISPEQTCNVKHRKIQHNLSLLRDFAFLSNVRNWDAFILSVDQLKAFDRVNWRFLDSVLERMNFPELIRTWVETLYRQIKSKVKINGHLSVAFEILRGVRQGCPFSAIL